ncbi:hypothetical protein A6A03_19410 [Chloroflexus islandicus]|uniref:Uncharacterized protein n=1 Tax=Chloroflexus islandicus TaxID=1707952 RepID=A0A178LYT5_9CHLR|nr:hypothetical protein [Chloroflexus islandicus]OAN40036.1 hypothetical protein A6A03_19410 [Chloroflexus islandicus]
MSVLLPDQRLWATNRWIARQFFADAIQWIDAAPALAGEIRFCLEAELDTLDLRYADRATLQAFAALVKKVVDYRTAMGASDVAEHNDVLVYMSKLMELSQLVQATLVPCS